jgi:uncharacterized RDD family membrane protein YckC
MHEPLPDSDLVVATPERVSFDYQVAGVATRGIANLLDLLILIGVLAGLYFAAFAIDAAGAGTVADLMAIIGSFVVVFGYFWACEAFWRGQTVGKRVFRLRAVGDRGEPMTFIQAGIRNVVRIIDFLPYAYGVGLVVLFINGRGKRLGDLAAGTIVVKDSDSVWLWQLPGGRPPPGDPTAPQAWGAPPPGAPPPAPPTVAPATPAQLALRRLDPDLRRLVASYARRRIDLPVALRAQLAGQLLGNLEAAVPDVFNQYGPLAALDHLADLERQG